MHNQPLAYFDPEFLDSDEARPIRILLGYLEPLRRFRLQNIQDTVVFFGSARVHSRIRAEGALRRLRDRGNTVATIPPPSSAAARRWSGPATMRMRDGWRRI